MSGQDERAGGHPNRPWRRARSIGSTEDRNVAPFRPRDRAKWTDIALIACAIVAATVSYWQWRVAHDQLAFAIRSATDSSRDTRAALEISGRIAKASENQVVQAAASAAQAKRSADAATTQRDDFRRQTAAVVKQASALIQTAQIGAKSAQAQLAAAEAISVAQSPAGHFGGLRLDNWDGKPNAKGIVEVKAHFWFLNTGNVFVVPGVSTFHFKADNNLGSAPDKKNTIYVGGNDIAVQPGSAWGGDGATF